MMSGAFISVFLCSLVLVQALPPDLCRLPYETGRCEAATTKWFHNARTGQCEEFMYGGCDGNDNKFDSMRECETTCIPELMGTKEGCSLIQCYKICEDGWKKDSQGCDLCECKNGADPEPYVVCDEVECTMECPDGFKKDATGCPVCECAAKCGPVMCAMDCEHGFQVLEHDCQACKCREKPACPIEKCFNECPWGYLVNANGCETCECRTESECLDVQCYMECPGGMLKDKYGCSLCQCSPPSCENYPCPDGEQCEMIEQYASPGQIATPVCVDPKAVVGCSEVTCMHCEHGFKKDVYGCKKCECLTSTPLGCGRQGDCKKWCDFGYQYTEEGCRTCRCMSDPCQSYKCPRTKVCEAHRQCQAMNCPARARCIGDSHTKRLSVQMQFAHKPLTKDLEPELFKKKLLETISSLLQVKEEDIKGIEITKPNNFTMAVAFHVINDGEDDVDLIAAYEKFKHSVTEHDENSAVLYDDVTFVPEHASLSSSFSSSAALPDEYDDMDKTDGEGQNDSRKLIIIIACAAGGGILLVVVVSLIVSLTRKKKATGSSNLAYNKAPMEDVNA